MDHLPDDFFTTSFQFTEHIYRDVYPSIEPTSPNLSQAGRVVVITGANGDIARQGIVPAFAKANPKAIVLVGRSAPCLRALEEDIAGINPKIEVLSVSTDVTDENSIAGLFDAIRRHFGTVDVLVNNAGILGAEDIPLRDGAFKEWWSNFDVNVKGTALMCKGFLQLLGSGKRGNIVNLTAGLAVMVRPGASGYSLSKLVAHQMTAFIAAENSNVTAVGLHPGIVKTRLVSGPLAKFAKDTPALVGGVSVWLTTEDARFLSGRFVASNWSVDDLVSRKAEIEKKNLLTIQLNAELGTQQFGK